jgi:hypothetical protein
VDLQNRKKVSRRGPSKNGEPKAASRQRKDQKPQASVISQKALSSPSPRKNTRRPRVPKEPVAPKGSNLWHSLIASLKRLLGIERWENKMAERWIQKAIKKPGALRAQLGAEKGKPIPAKKLAAAAKKPGKLGQRARLAQTLKKMK